MDCKNLIQFSPRHTLVSRCSSSFRLCSESTDKNLDEHGNHFGALNGVDRPSLDRRIESNELPSNARIIQNILKDRLKWHNTRRFVIENAVHSETRGGSIRLCNKHREEVVQQLVLIELSRTRDGPKDLQKHIQPLPESVRR